jgi:hypothetical protein
MARTKIGEGNKNVSISLPLHQLNFIKSHSTFNLSKFVQIHLSDYISKTIEVEQLEKEAKYDKTKTVIC